MDLVSLQGWLDNASFLILFLTMLAYWTSAAFPQWSALWSLGTVGMAIANLTMATLLGARWIEAAYFPLSNLYESLFFLAWGFTAVHLFAEYSSRSRWVGTVTAPAAMGITAFAALTLPGHYAGLRAPGSRTQIQLADDARQGHDAQLRHIDGGLLDGDRLS